MADKHIYLNDNFEPVDPESATLLKIIEPDGRIIFATPAEPPVKSNSLRETLFGWIPRMLHKQGGKGSGNFGHSGLPGKHGGSRKKGAGGGAGVSLRDMVRSVKDRLKEVSDKFERILAKDNLTNEERKEWQEQLARWDQMTPLSQSGKELDDGSKQFYLFKQDVMDELKQEGIETFITEDEMQDIIDEKILENFGDDVDVDPGAFVTWEKMSEDGYMYSSLPDFAKETYNYDDEETGVQMRVYKIRDLHDSVEFKGSMLDPDGREIGSFTQTVNAYGEVSHDYLAFNKRSTEWQGKGIGMRFYHHMEESYKAEGIFGIVVRANITVGGYAWAASGYSWNENITNGRAWTRDFVEDWVDAGYAMDLLPESLDGAFPDDGGSYVLQPFEMASIYSPDGEHFGKEYLLGTNWHGVKYLQEGIDERYDVGLEVAEEYYKSKGL